MSTRGLSLLPSNSTYKNLVRSLILVKLKVFYLFTNFEIFFYYFRYFIEIISSIENIKKIIILYFSF